MIHAGSSATPAQVNGFSSVTSYKHRSVTHSPGNLDLFLNGAWHYFFSCECHYAFKSVLSSAQQNNTELHLYFLPEACECKATTAKITTSYRLPQWAWHKAQLRDLPASSSPSHGWGSSTASSVDPSHSSWWRSWRWSSARSTITACVAITALC